MQLTIDGPRSIAVAESDLRAIGAARNEPALLLLPSRLVGAQLGGLASTLQVIATWASRLSGQELILQASQTGDIDEATVGDHWLVASLFADRILDGNGLDITPEFTRLAASRLKALDDNTGGRILCLSDDSISGFQSPRLYRQHSGISSVSLAAIEELVDDINDLLDREYRPWPNEERSTNSGFLRSSLVDLLFELIENTYEHGRHRLGPSGERTMNDHSIRYLRAVPVQGARAELNSLIDPTGVLFNYIARSLPLTERRESDHISLIELTCFDSGEGLAYWMAHEDGFQSQLAFKDEIRATARSLLKNQGSGGGLFFGTGQGIVRAMQAISALRGFVRVRTGRLSMYRDFAESPLDPSEVSDSSMFEIEPRITIFKDTQTRASDFLQAPAAAGTVYSIFLPLTPGRA